MFLVLNMVVRVFLATVLSSYTFLWIINNYAKWLKWDSAYQTCMSNLITETKWKMLLVFDCLCWNLDFCLLLSCLSNRFYTGVNRLCTSVSLIPASVSGHKMFVQLPQYSCVSPDWSRVPTSIPQAFPSCLCLRLCLISKPLKVKYNVAINIAVSYGKLKMYGISTLVNVYALFSAYLVVEHLKIK